MPSAALSRPDHYRRPCRKQRGAAVTPTPARGLDLKEIALAIGDEQSTTTELLQAIHAPVPV